MPIGSQEGLRRLLWTLDVGNSRAKLRSWRVHCDARRELELVPTVATRADGLGSGGVALERLLEELAEITDAAFAQGERPVVAYSCVAEPDIEDRLAFYLRGRLSPRALLSPESGLDNVCHPPAAVGRDRLFAARGAVEQLGRSAIVVDVGSAVTVDVVTVGTVHGERRAQFRGGAIAAGPAMLASALHHFTARLPAVDVRPGAPAVGTNTRAAIEAGVFHGLRGAVRELVDRAGEQMGDRELALVVTGGAASWLLDPPLFGERAVLLDPDLVHRGLAHAALELLSARESELHEL